MAMPMARLLWLPSPKVVPSSRQLGGLPALGKRPSVGFRIESKVRTKDQDEDSGSSSSEVGILGTAAIASGLISSPVIGWSLYTLKTTGCGLPPGPGGSIGALEGISYLVVIGIVSWSLVTKARTGTGLPNGPYGLLGAVEGLSYLALLAIVVVFGLQFLDQGFIPGPLPGDQCYG
ncbi:uncharacterized protein LOC116249843 [Nymphaea colorata]|uniref:uncharacterized protein LOC116249843 n=1 Tax=Nymphaea colorata TaxID=210225 RepID=UPI00129EDB4B|nr:uncharacterized protein LOC116249843 [Nymphaea colorata]